MSPDGNKYTILDYSHAFFVDLKDQPLPKKRGGRFVLIGNMKDRYIVFSPSELSPFHAHIVERFLSLRGVAGRSDEETGAFEPESSEWDVIGGGFWQLDEDAQVLRIYGESMAYGSVDLKSLAQILRNAGAFNGIKVL